jgi:hypothetical protein
LSTINYQTARSLGTVLGMSAFADGDGGPGGLFGAGRGGGGTGSLDGGAGVSALWARRTYVKSRKIIRFWTLMPS